MPEVASIRVSTVGWVVLGSTVASALGLRGWQALGNELPRVPWLTTLPLTMLIVLVLWAAWQVRGYARRSESTEDRHGRRAPHAPQASTRAMLTPQRARGTLVAAQAAILGGGALVGWYLAIALLNLPNADVVSVRGLVLRALVSAAVAAGLAVAGLVAQAWCRLPPEEDDEDGPQGLSYV